MATQPIDLKAVKKAAKVAFGDRHDVTGFGIGDGVLRIYVQTPGARSTLPQVFRGAPVEFVVTGDITASKGSGGSSRRGDVR